MAANALSGLRAVCGPVARAGALRRPRGKRAGCCRIFPEAMLRICPGYASPAVCSPVARAGALRRPRGKRAECCRTFPEAMLRICPGYASPAVCGPVARARRFAPPPGETCRMLQNFPGGDAAHLSGLRVPGGLWSRSPGKALCAAPGGNVQDVAEFSRRRCCASVRATRPRRSAVP